MGWTPYTASARVFLMHFISFQISDIKDALASIYGVVPKVQCLPPKQVRGAVLCFVALCLYREDRLTLSASACSSRSSQGQRCVCACVWECVWECVHTGNAVCALKSQMVRHGSEGTQGVPVYSGIMYNSQTVAAAQVSTDECVDEDVVYTQWNVTQP